jgi:hypothetical protein
LNKKVVLTHRSGIGIKDREDVDGNINKRRREVMLKPTDDVHLYKFTSNRLNAKASIT